MKLHILRLLVITLAGASAFFVITNVRAEKAASSMLPQPVQQPAVTAAQQDKPTEQVQKNIKVLTGLPQWQLIPVMNYMAASMGRRCNYCHVNNNGQWDYASDDKQEKNTAREMIKLVLDTNKNTFKGNVEVGCYTCHRGRSQPNSIPALPLPVPSPGAGQRPGGGGPPAQAPGQQPQAQASPSATPAQPTADDILNKYINAIGGTAAIDKIKTRVMKGTMVTANGQTISYELHQTAPNKAYELFTTQRGSMERAVNGETGWEKNPQGVHELVGQQLADLKLSMQLFRNIKLKEQFTRLRFGGREKIGDRDAYVLNAGTADNRRERLYFDAENGLLLRRVSFTQTLIGVIPEQIDFEDYRDVEGVKLPFTIRLSSVDPGNPISTRKFDEIKLNGPIDDSKFNLPPKPATP
ncbi:MAG TPA: c-type cytochrome [Pyrinomonadaceae bacterium]|nr:c-type cytochrome [Pyrinomonadaceae bacterium]